jgi:uncharacterized phage protein (TIGR02220 family)
LKKGYYAIIPANVRYDENLNPNAKLLYGEITALCNEKGYCWAGNSYFANLYKKDKSTIARWIRELEDNGYITREVIYKEGSREIKSRYMQLCNGGIGKNAPTPIGKSERDNNTKIFNTTINNTSNKDMVGKPDIPYKEIVEHLNNATNKNYRHSTRKTKDLIKTRWNEGFTLEDFKKVIDIKNAEWKDSEKWSKYLQPTTLFGTKFEGYLNQDSPKLTGYDPNRDAF